MLVKEPPLKDQNGKDPDRDRRIGQVENGPEEDEFLAGSEGEPLRKMTLDDGEVEHVNHLAIQQGRVASPLGE